MRSSRASGILLHPTSLPGRFGIGDMGDEAYRFVDWLVEAGQTYWQILPLTPTGYGNSPYSSFSAFAGNTLLISPEKLAEEELIESYHIEQPPELPVDHVDFGQVYEWKTGLLHAAVNKFHEAANNDLRAEFEAFSAENTEWLDDLALYRAIKAEQGQKPWHEWDAPLKLRTPEALYRLGQELNDKIDAEKFYQFLFFREWLALKKYANDNGIKIIGDVPIFVALDSADVWCDQGQFKLGADGLPLVVSGVPPDYFSKTGQLWGNPIYDWDAMQGDGFSWWIKRLAFALKSVDLVRLDHFIGFVRMWEVPAGDKTAENGKWAAIPGNELFSALKNALGGLPFIAEDLGAVTPEVEELRDTFGLPGMRILQYAFGGDPDDIHLPHNYVRNCVSYTGTHDNDTCVGWYRSAEKKQRALCRKYLRARAREISWDMITGVLASVADTAIITMQDILGLGSDARMNTPATASGNWEWRMRNGDMSSDAAARLREMAETYGRTGANEIPVP